MTTPIRAAAPRRARPSRALSRKPQPAARSTALIRAASARVTITKSISIICDNTEGGILVAATNAIIVNGAGAVVQISGIDFEGLGQTGSSANLSHLVRQRRVAHRAQLEDARVQEQLRDQLHAVRERHPDRGQCHHLRKRHCLQCSFGRHRGGPAGRRQRPGDPHQCTDRQRPQHRPGIDTQAGAGTAAAVADRRTPRSRTPAPASPCGRSPAPRRP